MIIHSSKHNSRSIAKEKVKEELIVSEEIKPVIETKKNSKTEKKKKITPAPIVEEPVVVEDEKFESEDLSQWLED